MWESFQTPFNELTLFLAVVAGIALIIRWLKLPLLMAYMLAGLAMGPLLGNLHTSGPFIVAAQEIAFCLLLFVVGLELNWVRVRVQLKSGALVAGLLLIGSFICGYFVAQYLGLNLAAGLVIGSALSFTSGVAVMKLLTESKDVSSLHGRLTGSIILIQDLVGIVVLMILGSYLGYSQLTLQQETAFLLMKGISILAVFWFSARFVLPILFQSVAKSSELLLLVSLSWCFMAAAWVHSLNFPLEAGALLAGLSLASLPYSIEVLVKIRSLRDFFLVVLFINLGLSITPLPDQYLKVALGLTALVVLGRPIVAYLTLSLNGYRVRTSFLTAISQSQLSELTLVITLIGWHNGLIDTQIVSLLSLVTVGSMLIASLLYHFRISLNRLLQPILKLTERGHHLHKELILGDQTADQLKDHVVLFGYHRMGYPILKQLQKMKLPLLIVDFNPEVIEKMRMAGLPAIYGDIEDETIFTAANIDQASMVISTVPRWEETKYLITRTKELNSKTTIIVTTNSIDDALAAYDLGADYVLLPLMLGAEHIGELIGHHHRGTLKEFVHHHADELKLTRTKENELYYD